MTAPTAAPAAPPVPFVLNPLGPYTPATLPAGTRLTMAVLESWFAAELQRIATVMPYRVHVDPREFGLSGMGETDESDKLQELFDTVPDRCAIVPPTPDFKIGLYKSVELREKTGVAWVSPVWHRDDYANEYGPNANGRSGVQLIWGGNAGERVLGVINSGYCRLSGFSIHGGNAGVGIDVDQTATRTRICTSNTFERMRLVGGVGNRDWTAVRISAVSRDNCEYMGLDDCYMAGNGDLDPTQALTGASMRQGSNVLEWTGTFGDPATLVGTRVRLAGAGPIPQIFLVDPAKGAGRFNRRLLDARILERIDDHHVRLDQAAQATVSNVRWLLDEALGTGLQNGPSQNNMRQIVRNLTAVSLSVGIDALGGSVHTLDYNAGSNDENWRVGNFTPDSCSETRTNSENSRVHLTLQSIPPFTSTAPSLRPNNVCPGTGYIKLLPGTYSLFLRDGQIIGKPPEGTTVFDFTEAAGALIASENMRYGWDYDAETMGIMRRGEPQLGEDATALLEALPWNCLFDSAGDMQPGGAIFGGGRRMWGDRGANFVFAHRGRWVQSTPATPVQDAQLEPQQSSEYVDEQRNELVRRVRYSDGRLGTVREPITLD